MRALGSLMAGHFAVDFTQGAVPALIVFLRPKFDLSYLEVALVMLAATFSSSLAQPLFGLWSDRRGGLWMLPVGVATAGIALAVGVNMPSYPLLLAGVGISATGVGGFHPEAAKYSGFASSGHLASAISLFSLGGNIGLAAGPFAASLLVLWLGLQGAYLLALPCLVVAGMLFGERHHLASLRPARRSRTDGARHEKTQRGALTLLLTVVGLRSLAFYGLLTFVPLWEISLGSGRGHATLLLTLMLLGGAMGTVIAGRLGDRFGGRPVLIAGSAIAAVCVILFVLVGGPIGIVLLILSGAATVGTFGITTSMSQQYMPGQLAMASGLSMGFSIGLGGVAAVLLGAAADAIDLEAALLISGTGAGLAAALALFLPTPHVSLFRGCPDGSDADQKARGPGSPEVSPGISSI